jgi:hypothetical protein
MRRLPVRPEAKCRIAEMVKLWKIIEDQAVGNIDRRAIQKLKALI